MQLPSLRGERTRDAQLKPEERDFDNYYAERLFAMDTAVHAICDLVVKHYGDGGLPEGFCAFELLHQAASDRMQEVEDYIKALEARIAVLEGGSLIQ